MKKKNEKQPTTKKQIIKIDKKNHNKINPPGKEEWIFLVKNMKKILDATKTTRQKN